MLLSFYDSFANIMGGSGISEKRALLIKLQGLALQANTHKLEKRDVNIEQIQEPYTNVSSKQGECVMDIEPLWRMKEIVEKKKAALCENSWTARPWLQRISSMLKHTKTSFVLQGRRIATCICILQLQWWTFLLWKDIIICKSTRIYLQQMSDLPERHPWLHKKFTNEKLFVAWRSDRYWASLWSDLIIEQVTMVAIKIRGGLTQGNGFTESAHILWIYSMHASSSYHSELSALTNNTHDSSLQHENLVKSCLKRDFSNL